MTKSNDKLAINIILLMFILVFIYPLIWMFLSSFKGNNEILVSLIPWPKEFLFGAYKRAWFGVQFNFGLNIINSLKLVVPVVVLTVLSSVTVGYGFARFKFPFKNFLFSLMLMTLMLPSAVVIIPRYMLFAKIHWVDTYWPFIAPAAFGSAFFIYMMVQFIRGLPRELDESAYMDGCGPVDILLFIIVPLVKPAIVSIIIFQFVWTWNNFFEPLIYINSVKKYTVQLALRMSMDIAGDVDWGALLAKSTIVLIPSIIVFFAAQKYFIEGVATSGMKN